jgi:hypothetical protein
MIDIPDSVHNIKLPAIYQSLQDVNNDLGVIAKDQQGYGYKFRGINQVLDTIGPLFKRHCIIVSQKVISVTPGSYQDEKGRRVKTKDAHIIYKFTSTVDGSVFEVEGVGEGEDRGDKSTGALLSNTYKYVIFTMFNIPTQEMEDSDMKTAREESESPKKEFTKSQQPKETETKEAPSERKWKRPSSSDQNGGY